VVAQLTVADGLIADIATDRSDYLLVGDRLDLLDSALDSVSAHEGT
jgi:hypothetical protein